MYFNNFPKMSYPFTINGKTEFRTVMDITKNVRLRREILSNVTLFDTYIIKDGETPELIAEYVYGNAQYHWTILLANDLYDYLSDFPLSQAILDNVIIDKYGVLNIHKIHHYEGVVNGRTFIVDKDFIGHIPISNSDYEYNLNEEKRTIKIISPNFINQIVSELNKI
jgi:hypothetical protein